MPSAVCDSGFAERHTGRQRSGWFFEEVARKHEEADKASKSARIVHPASASGVFAAYGSTSPYRDRAGVAV